MSAYSIFYLYKSLYESLVLKRFHLIKREIKQPGDIKKCYSMIIVNFNRIGTSFLKFLSTPNYVAMTTSYS